MPTMNTSTHPRALAIHEQVKIAKRHLAEANSLHAERELKLIDTPDDKKLMSEMDTLENEIAAHHRNIARFESALGRHNKTQSAAALAELRAAQDSAAAQANQQASARITGRARKIDKLIVELRAELEGLEDDDTTLHRTIFTALRDAMDTQRWRNFDISAWARLLPRVAEPLREALSSRWLNENSFEAHAAIAADRLSSKLALELSKRDRDEQ